MMTERPDHRYRLFGLSIASEIALPELAETATDSFSEKPDLFIRRGRPSDTGGGFELDVTDVARFFISDGSAIFVSPVIGASSREVRLFLLGSAMGIAMHQRGMLPLHSNAIALDNSAIAFMGQSGAGKSTLAAWFHDRGFPILADDVCVVELNGSGRPIAYPGLPRLRLWQDVLEATGRIAADHPLSFHTGSDDRRKYDVRVPFEGIAGSPLDLRALIVLEQGSTLELERITGAAALEAISANTYRGGYISDVGDTSVHFRTCLRLAQKVPVYRFARPFDLASFDGQCETILAMCQAELGLGKARIGT